MSFLCSFFFFFFSSKRNAHACYTVRPGTFALLCKSEQSSDAKPFRRRSDVRRERTRGRKAHGIGRHLYSGFPLPEQRARKRDSRAIRAAAAEQGRRGHARSRNCRSARGIQLKRLSKASCSVFTSGREFRTEIRKARQVTSPKGRKWRNVSDARE